MWLCKLIGHTHVESHCGWSQFKLAYCLRCFASSVTREGDDVLLCKVLGHKDRKVLIGDYDCQLVTLNACFRCHAKVN